MTVLRKAVQLKQQGAMGLLNALLQPNPTVELPLATENSLGIRLKAMT